MSSLPVLPFLVALLAGCADDSGGATTAPRVVTSVVVAPTVLSLAAGTSSTIAAVARDQEGVAMPGAPVSWSSSDTSVATVSAGGVVSARRPGAAMVSATAGGRSGAVAVTVIGSPTDPTVAVVATDAVSLDLGVGDTRTIVARALDASGAPLIRPFAWRTSDAAVATVDAAGRVLATGAGTAIVTVTAEGREAAVRVTVTGQAWKLTRVADRSLPAPLYGTSTTAPGGATRVDTTWVTGGTLRMRGERYELRLQGWTITNGGAPVAVTFGSDGVVAYDVFDGTTMFHESDTWWDREPRFRGRTLEDGRLELGWNVAPNAPVVPLVFAR